MKFFLPAILLFYCLSAYSQSFSLLASDEEYFMQAGDLHTSNITIQNNSQGALNLAIRILEINTEGSAVMPNICLGDNCLEEQSILEVSSLKPGEIVDQLSLTLQAGNEESQGILRYIIFDIDNPSNALEHSIRFHVQGEFPGGIMYQRPDLKVSNAYPNPIVSSATIDYSFTVLNHAARILVLNILGNQVMQFDLLDGQHSVKIPTDQLSNGIYFYTLQLDGKNVATKKMVVRK